MTCFYPLAAWRTANGVVFDERKRHGDYLGRLELPCGRCIGCRMRRRSDWALRVGHEASLWKQNCFLTLTYGEGQMPAGGSLDHKDFQLFMRRVRKYFRHAVRFYMCGEYGPLNLRPHYHACLFNADFLDRDPAGKSASGAVFYNSPTLSKLWPHGHASVQDLTPQTAAYCAGYIMDKELGDDAQTAYEDIDVDGVITQRRPPYSAMSLKPGIGARWFDRFGGGVYPNDFIVQDGVKRRPPKYYDKLLARSRGLVADQVAYAREQRGRAAHADNTEERLRVRETVTKARVRHLKREL